MEKYIEKWCGVELFSYTACSKTYVVWVAFSGVEWKIPAMQQYDGVDTSYDPRTGRINIYGSFCKQFLIKDIVLDRHKEHIRAVYECDDSLQLLSYSKQQHDRYKEQVTILIPMMPDRQYDMIPYRDKIEVRY